MFSDLNVDRFLSGKPLALTLGGLEELRGHIEARLALFAAGPQDFAEALVADRSTVSSGRRSSAVGVIPIRGTISQHARGEISSALFGGATTEAIAAQLREFLADDTIGKIVLDIDSPGGVAYGVTELASEIYRSRGPKPIVAVANSMAASAAYWIGSAADEFYVTPSGHVGSIGVYSIHQDWSKAYETAGVKPTIIKAGKFKALGNEFQPLDEEGMAHIQSRVDEVYETFVRDVARGRGVTEAVVRSKFGEGDIVSARAAKAAGMVDGIYTYEQVLRRPAKASALDAAAANDAGPDIEAEGETPHPQAADEEGARRLARMRLRDFQARAAASGAA